ncbi:50S ribosomal protein L9 [Synechococcales cyanobacterium C]|uniref:Large ribosomal subunit protein bL9 n=1 Tax=Petrachloros mirabilis ULC683 TaxID=2781853 RepID=A0A8K2A8R6_9CYAN|nr:50S ribosomal protein L9 [Petrachloros mirabilis]NCJ08346.1 50S ribosomal protein L9 [Petrachloros mirabilis ULC683]
MAKRIQLVLNQDVSKLGRSGDLVEVAPGYARNYLLPRGMALQATPGLLKQVERRRAEELKRLAEQKKEAEAQKTTLQTIGTFKIAKKSGEEDTLFGSVTAPDVAAVIQETANLEIDRRNITIPEIRKLGLHTFEVKLHPEVIATLKIEVVPD